MDLYLRREKNWTTITSDQIVAFVKSCTKLYQSWMRIVLETEWRRLIPLLECTKAVKAWKEYFTRVEI